MWVKYKHTFSYGKDKDWKYFEVDNDWEDWGYRIDDYATDDYNDPPSVEERLYEFLTTETGITDEYSYSEQYRGIEYEILDGFPPYEEIKGRLLRAEGSVEYYEAQVIKYQDMLDQVGELKKEDFDI